MSRSPSSRHANPTALERRLTPPRTPVFKAYDKALNVWFQASTKAELLYLMNQPGVVARRHAAMQLQAIVDESAVEERTARLFDLAASKRLRKAALRLKHKDRT